MHACVCVGGQSGEVVNSTRVLSMSSLEFGSHCVCMGCIQGVRRPSQSEHMHVRLTCDSKLSVGVNVSVNGCWSLFVSLAINLQPWDSFQSTQKWKKMDELYIVYY